MSLPRYREIDARALHALARWARWKPSDKDVSKIVVPKVIRRYWVQRRWARKVRGSGYVLKRLGMREVQVFMRTIKR